MSLADEIARTLEQPGMVKMQTVQGKITDSQNPLRFKLTELAEDPDPPADGAYLYLLGDNGSGKAELRLIYSGGSPQTLHTEP